MSLTSIFVTIGQPVPSGPTCPVDPPAIAGRGSAARTLREESWENEGGGLCGTQPLPLPRASPSPEIGAIGVATAQTGRKFARS